MNRLPSLRAAVTAAAAAAALLPAPAGAQGYPQLQVARIWTQGAPAVGDANVFRANIRNSSQIAPARGRITVVLDILDPDQKRSTYEASILNLGPNGAQAVAFNNVTLPKPGAYIVTVIVDPDGEFTRGGKYPTNSNRRTETFTAGAAQDAGAYRLIVTVTEKGRGVNALRVAVKTAEGREIAWRNTSGTGQAQFPELPPSPKGKPYTIEVKRFARVLATETYAMPAQDALFEVKLDGGAQ